MSSSPIATGNRHGWTNDRPNELSESFIEHAGRTRGRCLDVGAAFGVATLGAVRAGATVIANDLDEAHLRALIDRASPEERTRITLLPGRFPDYTLEDGSLDAVHASNVFHFLRGHEIERGLTAIARWLRPSGRLFLLACTPATGNLQELRPGVDARRAAGARWPGECDDVQITVTHESVAALPPFLHLLTRETLVPAVEAAGLRVVRAEEFTRRDIPAFSRGTGGENLLVIAERP